MSRRRTKTERELIADLMDSCRSFCSSQKDCKSCPLRAIKLENEHDFSCIRAYAYYLLEGKGDDVNNARD